MTSLLATRPRVAHGSRRVVVIGGGIAGLATAALLASRGHSVDLLEKNDELGGRVGSFERDGFRFDTGASWYLMPEVFEHFFSMLGTSADAELDLTVLDPSYRVFFQGHPEPVDVRPDRRHNRALFESLEPGAGEQFDAYLDSADRTYEMALRHFLYSNFDSASAFLHPDVVRRAPTLSRLLTRSLDSHVAGRFSDNRLRQLLGYPAVFLGSSPSRAPSMYHLMSRLDLGDRVLYPQGGFRRLVEVVAALAERHGARIHTGMAVTGVLTGGGSRSARPRVTGVEAAVAGGRRMLPADVVVGAADLHHLETALLPPSLQTHPQKTWRRRSPGPVPCSRCSACGGGCPSWPTTRSSSPPTGSRTSATSSVAAPVSPTPPRSTSANPRRAIPRWRRRGARTSSSSSRCQPTWRSAAAGTTGTGRKRWSGRRTRRSTRWPPGPASPTCASASSCGTPSAPRTSPTGTTRGAAARSAWSTRCGRARSSARRTCRRRSTVCCTPEPVPSPGWGCPCA
nr:phytoene dehydrogenase [uncultured bacterium]